MKRFVFLLMAMFAMVCTACSDDKDQSPTDDSLVGTAWYYSEIVDGVEVTITFAFINKDLVQMIVDGEQGTIDLSFTVSGTYIYNKPSITMNFTLEDEPYYLSGTVEGDRMKLIDEGEKIVFKRR